MSSEREHLENQVGSPERASRPVHEAAATSPPLGSVIGNAAFTRLVQRAELGSQGAGPLDPDIGEAIRGQAGGGAPLPEAVRSDMEGHFGYDLSAVRVHTGSAAASLNRSVQAEAFTTGTDIFFQPGSYNPGSSAGKELLAHELTHVVQQSSGTAGSESRVSSPHDHSEVEARSVAREIVSRQAAPEADEDEA